MGGQFCQKKQNGQRMSFEFLDCMALATIPVKLLLDILLRVTSSLCHRLANRLNTFTLF